MLTESPLTEVTGPEGVDSGPGERARRLQRRRRLIREELLAVAVLLVVLAVTVAVLATQWLASGPSANAARSGVPTHPALIQQPTDYGGIT